jgi:hypothetical protein
MNRRIALIAVCLAGTLFGIVDQDRKPVEVTKTDKFPFPEGGTLRMDKSIGDADISGWDEAGVEITTTKATKDIYFPKDREVGLKDLEHVGVSAKVSGDALIVTTQFPKHKAFPWLSPVSDTNKFDLSYKIKVPRNARILVTHGAGDVSIYDVAGNIDVTLKQGLITLLLKGDAPRTISAKADLGTVESDYPGTETRRPWPMGHDLIDNAAGTSQKLNLKIGFGDIVIRKAFEPTPAT